MKQIIAAKHLYFYVLRKIEQLQAWAEHNDDISDKFKHSDANKWDKDLPVLLGKSPPMSSV